MKKLAFLVLALFLVAAVSNTAMAQDKKDTKKSTTVEKKDSGKPVNSLCLVSGEETDPSITYVYKGVTYSVCCKRCLKKLEKDPEKYIKKYEESKKKSE